MDPKEWKTQYAYLVKMAKNSKGFSRGKNKGKLESLSEHLKGMVDSLEEVTDLYEEFKNVKNIEKPELKKVRIHDDTYVPVVISKMALPVEGAVVISQELFPAEMNGVAFTYIVPLKSEGDNGEDEGPAIAGSMKKTMVCKVDVSKKDYRKTYGTDPIDLYTFGERIMFPENGTVREISHEKMVEWIEEKFPSGKARKKTVIKPVVDTLEKYIPTKKRRIKVGEKVIDVHQSEIALLSMLAGENVLFVGSPGSGKTSLMKMLVSVLNGIPPEFLNAIVVQGSPGTTNTDIQGAYLDLAALNKGEMKVNWELKAFLNYVAVDELNRIPPVIQSQLLALTNNPGSRVYKNQTGPEKVYGALATANADGGIFETIKPLKDRFSIYVEMTTLTDGGKGFSRFKEDYSSGKSNLDELVEAYNKNPSEENLKRIREHITKIREEILKKMGYNEVPNFQEIKKEIQEVEVTKDAEAFMHYVAATYATINGHEIQKATRNEIVDNDKLPVQYSSRFRDATLNLAKALAWYFNFEEVNENLVATAMSYTLLSRVDMAALIRKNRDEGRKVTGEPYYTKNAQVFAKEALAGYHEVANRLKAAIKSGNPNALSGELYNYVKNRFGEPEVE